MENIEQLILTVCEAQEQLKQLAEKLNVEKLKAQLKKALLDLPANDEGKHLVIVEGVQAKVFMRKGQRKVDFDKLKALVHINTYNAVVTPASASPVLEVDRLKSA